MNKILDLLNSHAKNTKIRFKSNNSIDYLKKNSKRYVLSKELENKLKIKLNKNEKIRLNNAEKIKDIIDIVSRKIKKPISKNKWFTLKEKLPELNTYVLIYIDLPWQDKDDDPHYVVAKFIKSKTMNYIFNIYGIGFLNSDSVKRWKKIDKTN